MSEPVSFARPVVDIPAFLEGFMDNFELRIQTQAIWQADDVMEQFRLSMKETAQGLKVGQYRYMDRVLTE